MELTQHARVRMQQRGICAFDLDCLFRYGRTVYDHHGARVLYLARSSCRVVRTEYGPRVAERLRGLFAVVAGDGAVLTVGHRTRRIRHH